MIIFVIAVMRAGMERTVARDGDRYLICLQRTSLMVTQKKIG